jgi:CheY-like chemotaxis protein
MNDETGKPKVLVADEDKDVRFLIQMYLRDYNVEVIECRAGAECIESIKEKIPRLAIINYILGKYTAYQIGKEISTDESIGHIPIIMMTLEGFDLMEEGAGIDDYLAKPFNRGLFIETVKRIMGDKMFSKIEKEKELVLPKKILEKKEKSESDTKNIKKKILIADDEPDIIKLVKLILEKEYELDAVYSGEELVEKAGSKEYDLIISDVIMPKLSGWKSVKQIRDNGCNVPVIFNSGLVKDRELYETLKPEGPSYFILKPFRKETLLSLVKQVIDS